MYSVFHSYLFILLFQNLASSFVLTRPSSGEYLQKLKIAGAFNSSVLWDPIHSHYCSLYLIPAIVVLSVV